MLYQEQALESASGVELVVALYDGMIRFLNQAIEAVKQGDVTARRVAVKRTLDIIIHLQATLRMDVGGQSAEYLSEFYASIFAVILQGSAGPSVEKFEHAIASIWNVRDAWRQVAQSPEALGMVPADLRLGTEGTGAVQRTETIGETAGSWTA